MGVRYRDFVPQTNAAMGAAPGLGNLATMLQRESMYQRELKQAQARLDQQDKQFGETMEFREAGLEQSAVQHADRMDADRARTESYDAWRQGQLEADRQEQARAQRQKDADVAGDQLRVAGAEIADKKMLGTDIGHTPQSLLDAGVPHMLVYPMSDMGLKAGKDYMQVLNERAIALFPEMSDDGRETLVKDLVVLQRQEIHQAEQMKLEQYAEAILPSEGFGSGAGVPGLDPEEIARIVEEGDKGSPDMALKKLKAKARKQGETNAMNGLKGKAGMELTMLETDGTVTKDQMEFDLLQDAREDLRAASTFEETAIIARRVAQYGKFGMAEVEQIRKDQRAELARAGLPADQAAAPGTVEEGTKMSGLPLEEWWIKNANEMVPSSETIFEKTVPEALRDDFVEAMEDWKGTRAELEKELGVIASKYGANAPTLEAANDWVENFDPEEHRRATITPKQKQWRLKGAPAAKGGSSDQPPYKNIPWQK